MRVIIDRFEGDFAVVETENEKFTQIPKMLIPDAKEGDVVDITINSDETAKRSAKIKNLMDSLFED